MNKPKAQAVAQALYRLLKSDWSYRILHSDWRPDLDLNASWEAAGAVFFAFSVSRDEAGARFRGQYVGRDGRRAGVIETLAETPQDAICDGVLALEEELREKR